MFLNPVKNLRCDRRKIKRRNKSRKRFYQKYKQDSENNEVLFGNIYILDYAIEKKNTEEKRKHSS